MVASIHASISVTNTVIDNNPYATEIARLHKKAVEFRQRAVETQLSLAFTLCEVAETEIRYSQPEQAMKLVNKIRHHTETITSHLDEPNHLPATAISSLNRQLTQLKKRTEAVESLLRQY